MYLGCLERLGCFGRLGCLGRLKQFGHMIMKKTRIAFIGAAVVCLAAMLAYVGWQRSADQPTAPSNTAEQNGAQQTELVYYDGTNGKRRSLPDRGVGWRAPA